MRWLILVAVLTATPASAEPPRLPPGVSCELVRAKVAEHGKVLAYAWALNNGLSLADIYRIKKRCRL
jgi:hypothetical protein